MARRRRSAGDEAFENLTDVLAALPVWVGPLLAFLTYVLIRFAFAPMMQSADSEVGRVLGSIAKPLAWIFPVLILFAWGISLFRRNSKRRLFDKQTGLGSIRELSWSQFEALVGEAFRRQGYQVRETGGSAPDGGVDLVLTKGREKTLVQCKLWKAWSVGVQVIRELYGVMASTGADHGIVVSCGKFTKDAQRFAEGKSLLLIDGVALAKLVSGIQAKPTSTPESPMSTSNTLPTTCPKCGSAMTLRVAKKGPQPGSEFWGCTQYPACRGTRPCTA